MMFSLDLPTEPYWIELPLGVRVQVRPLSGVVIAAARSKADRQVLDIMRERVERLAAKMPVDDLPDVDDRDMRHGIFTTEFIAGLARYGIIAWEGVGNGADELAPVTAENLDRFARSSLGPTFKDRYEKPLETLAAEGNGSAAAPNGGSAAGTTTADGAQTSTTETAAPNAPAA
jgi:hypothetical protein